MKLRLVLLALCLEQGRSLLATRTTSVSQGELRGKVVKSAATGKTYVAFQGVPYAKPPVGPLRFKDPEPLKSWSGVLDSTKAGADCIQSVGPFSETLYKGKEDCLFLNVYTPKMPEDVSSPLYPVMVWIHGGAFIIGSGDTTLYGPDYLVAKDVVVVTLNYRLGVLGFASLYNPEVPGNMGMKDQVTALRWVKDNIRAFSGDPGQVTIFGESAGSASVHFLMLSPLARGLFHRVICQSGSVLNPWAFKKSLKDNMDILAKRVNCKSLDTAALAECLRKVPAGRLAALSFAVVTPEDERAGVPLPFAVTPDDSFMPAEPRQVLGTGDFQSVPFLAGVNTGEGLLTLNAFVAHYKMLDTFNKDFERFVPVDLNLPRGSEESKGVADKVKQFYFKGGPITMKNLEDYKDMTTDRFFLLGVRQALNMQANFTKHPQYLYEMAFEGKLGFFKPFLGNAKMKGVCHADDMGYMWYMKLFPLRFPSFSPEMKTLNRIVTMWTNFAKTGDPTPETSELLPVKWLPYSPEKPSYLLIDKELALKTNVEQKRMDFWDSIYANRVTE